MLGSKNIDLRDFGIGKHGLAHSSSSKTWICTLCGSKNIDLCVSRVERNDLHVVPIGKDGYVGNMDLFVLHLENQWKCAFSVSKA